MGTQVLAGVTTSPTFSCAVTPIVSAPPAWATPVSLSATSTTVTATSSNTTAAKDYTGTVTASYSFTGTDGKPYTSSGTSGNIDINVTHNKIWDVGTPIGTDLTPIAGSLDQYGNQLYTQVPITMAITTPPPAGQTEPSPPPTSVVAASGQPYGVSVLGAVDWDHFIDGVQSIYVAGTVNYSWTCSGGSFTGSTTGASPTWNAPTTPGNYTVTCTINDDSDTGTSPDAIKAPDTGTRYDDSPQHASVTFIVPTFTLNVARHGSSDTPGASTTVAAGGLSSDEHKADVSVIATDTGGNPVAGAAVPKMTVSSGSGVTVMATPPDTSGAVTGADGSWSGTFESGDLVTDVTLTAANASATVSQAWDDVTDGSDYEFDPDYQYDAGNGVAFSPKFLDGSNMVPITGHSMQFEVLAVSFWHWDDLIDDYDAEAVATEAQIPDLAYFGGVPVQGDGNGSYSDALTVPFDIYNIADLDSITWDVVDNDVYSSP